MTTAQTTNLVVKKFGGASLSDPEKIKTLAARIAKLAQKQPLVIVVSAMGNTTNSLIELAHQVAQHPSQREMDMLLSVGERISMSLMSMALNEQNCQAISFTGSQAGIITSAEHEEARIIDVKALRVDEALRNGKLVIIAGFQGVSLATKEITTLGRGGSDTSAMALAAYLKCPCEIRKDVDGVFSADPNLVPQAHLIDSLSYDELLHMCFWGAKVLHYRSAELAKKFSVPIYIANAHTNANGTTVGKEIPMFEENQLLAVNTHKEVIEIEIQKSNSLIEGLGLLRRLLQKINTPMPQVLSAENNGSIFQCWITGPVEVLNSISSINEKNFEVRKGLSSVTCTMRGAHSWESYQNLLDSLSGISVAKFLSESQGVSFIIHDKDRTAAIAKLHALVGKTKFT